MYEKFSDKARKVMQFASQEAKRFNHEYVGTEHILLGIVKEGCGLAAETLRRLDVDIRKIRLEVEKAVQSGPYVVAMEKLPFTPRSKRVIEYAMEEARTRNSGYVGTEHLLLGLLIEQHGVAAKILTNLGVTQEKVNAIFGTEFTEETSESLKKNVAEEYSNKLHQIHHVLISFLFEGHTPEDSYKKVLEIVAK
mgnify:CR=1 FL=1